MTDVRSVTLERALPHPVEKVWRAISTPHLVAEWLMPGDIRPVPGHAFRLLSPGIGEIDCVVLEVDPPRRLTYSWKALGLDSIVTFTLEPRGTGTRLLLDQTGFASDQTRELHGARAGWGGFLDRLATVLERGDDR